MLLSHNSSSYFLQELQQCLKDPDWLAQLFIKHVRLGLKGGRAYDEAGLCGGRFFLSPSTLLSSTLSLLGAPTAYVCGVLPE